MTPDWTVNRYVTVAAPSRHSVSSESGGAGTSVMTLECPRQFFSRVFVDDPHAQLARADARRGGVGGGAGRDQDEAGPARGAAMDEVDRGKNAVVERGPVRPRDRSRRR